MAGRMSVFLNPKKQISAEYGTTNNEFTSDPFFPGIILLRYFKEYWHFLYDISGVVLDGAVGSVSRFRGQETRIFFVKKRAVNRWHIFSRGRRSRHKRVSEAFLTIIASIHYDKLLQNVLIHNSFKHFFVTLTYLCSDLVGTIQ